MSSSRSGRASRRALSVMLVSLLLFALVPSVASGATVYYVDRANGSDTTGNGSAGKPYRSITKAMNSITDGTIYVAPGTYDTATETFPIVVKPGVAVVGTEGADDTIVSAKDLFETFQIFSAASGTRLEGLKITGGSGVGEVGALRIEHTTGIASPGWPKIVDCDISDNRGGANQTNGIWVEGVAGTVSPTIEDCSITNNKSTVGGGVQVWTGGSPTFIRCTIADNDTVSTGGAIYGIPSAGTITLVDCDVSGNTALNGGGVHTSSNTAITGGSIRDNVATNSGGGIETLGGDLVVEGVEISGNSSPMGGGVHVCGTSNSAHFSDVAVFENKPSSGSAMSVHAGVVTVAHASVFDNTGNEAVEFSSGSLNVYNSIFWGNSGNDFSSAPNDIQKSCVEQGAIAGLGVIHTDPQLFDDENGDFRLGPDSPCIDTGGTTQSDNDDIVGTLRPQDGDGVGSAVPDMGCWERPPAEIDRHAGTDRFDTACQMARDAFDSADTAVLASGENFPDALSASGLAGAYEAPLLLTRQDSVPDNVADTMHDLGVDDVVIVGGPAAVSADVAAWLTKAGYDVTRIAGANRYATSAEIADEVKSIMGGDFSQMAFFARGDNFPDALAVAPLAYATASPVMLVMPGSVPTEIGLGITALDIEEGYVCGGTSAVSGTTKASIDTRVLTNGGGTTTRWFGTDRYETAAAIAANGVAAGFGDWGYVGIATGANFPDALAGGMLAGVSDGVVMLTATDSLPDPTRTALGSNKDIIVYCDVFGGTAAVSAAVQKAIDTALGW